MQAGKEEKEDHRKNNLVKKTWSILPEWNRILFPFGFCNLFLLYVATYDQTESLSQQLLQAFICMFLSIACCGFVVVLFILVLFFVFKQSMTTINYNSSVQLARKQKVNSKFCFTG